MVASLGPLPGVGATIRVTDLRDHPLVMFRTGYDLRDATLEACRAGRVRRRRSRSRAARWTPCSASSRPASAWPWCPAWCVAGRPRLRATPLAAPGLHRTIALAHRRDLVLPHSAQALRDTLVAQLHGGGLPPGVEPICAEPTTRRPRRSSLSPPARPEIG